MTPLNRSMVPPLASMFLIFMTILAVFSFGFNRSDNELRAVIRDSCVARNVNRANSNEVLDQLIASAEKSVAFKDAEKVERMAGWAALRQPPESC